MPAPVNTKPDASKFKCHQCGNCCRGDGFVELKDSDIDNIADYLGMERGAFLDEYAKYDHATDRWHLIDQGDELISCIFLVDNRCRVHPVKPHQCTGFPTRWKTNNIADYCEGWRAMLGLPPADKKTMSGE